MVTRMSAATLISLGLSVFLAAEVSSSLVPTTYDQYSPLYQSSRSLDGGDQDADGRFLFSNTTSVTVSVASMTAGLLLLVALALLAALVAYYIFGESAVYATSYSDVSSHSSGYGSGRSAQYVLTDMKNAMMLVLGVCTLCMFSASSVVGALVANSDRLAGPLAPVPSVSEQRFLITNGSSLSVGINSLYAGVLAVLGGLALLAALFFLLSLLLGDDEESGYSYSSGSSYARARAATASPYSEMFSNLSVLDWISLAEEIYRDFDTSSMDCQKRVICQLHENESKWGATARRMNTAFSYMQYLELLNLPEDVRSMLDEYLQAAEQGRSAGVTGGRDCAQLFSSCRLDIVALIEKYSHGN